MNRKNQMSQLSLFKTDGSPNEIPTFELDKYSIDDLFKRSIAFQGSKEFVKFFDFIAKFRHYSRFNCMLVYLQDKSVTFFGGASYWKNKFNRTVREEARPYVIMKPFSPVMLVYDIFQTEGNKTPEEFLQEGLGMNPHEVTGTISQKFLNSTVEAVRKSGITVLIKPLSYFTGGYITTILKGKLEIVLNEGLSNERNFTTLIHELGHLFMGHTFHNSITVFGKNNTRKEFSLLKRDISESSMELEAETISFLVCKRIGIERRSAEYLAKYIKSENDLKQFNYELVVKMADKIDEIFVNRIVK